jgi:hypothetical protein
MSLILNCMLTISTRKTLANENTNNFKVSHKNKLWEYLILMCTACSFPTGCEPQIYIIIMTRTKCKIQDLSPACFTLL